MFLFLVGLILAGSSCSNIKYLPKNENLYTGAQVKLIVVDGYKPKKGELKALRKSLESVTRPQPNAKSLGFFRFKLWLYNVMGEPKHLKGIRHYIKYNLGEAPVLASRVNATRNRDILTNKLENEGYFQSEVNYNIVTKNRKSTFVYTPEIKTPYTIKDIKFPSGKRPIEARLREEQDGSILKPGDKYNLDNLKSERERIGGLLKDTGYYYFDPEYILFKVDSSIGDKKVTIYVTLKDSIPAEGLRQYKIGEVYLNPDYSLSSDSAKHKLDTTYIEKIHFVQGEPRYKPKNIVRSVFVHPDDIYSHTDEENSLARLMALGTFKYVNVKLREQDRGSDKLDVYINCTSLQRQSLRNEIRLVSKSDNFIGPDVSTTYKNRNLLKGAELFETSLHTGYETIISGQSKGINSYVIGLTNQLTVPRFMIPFYKLNPSTKFVPKTIYRLDYQYISRVYYFNMSSLQATFGYKWNRSEYVLHEFYPISVNYVFVNSASNHFNELRNNNFYLQQSFQNQFIPGAIYSYTFNNSMKADRINTFFLNGTVDISGNLLNALEATLHSTAFNAQKERTVFGVPYSEYTRLSLDFRHYLKIDKKSKLATRLFSGIGLPYGNSRSMPYIKEFFSGGNNSVRAFAPRSLGPGTYHATANTLRGFYVDQAGDIKLEANTEYRFTIIGVFKGAVFLDAGNIWLFNNDPNRPGGQFNVKTFTDEFAVGTGTGLRIDASFFVLRFDFGLPLRKPWLPQGQRWVLNTFDPLSGKWLTNNLVLNIGIGYPF
jgi:outer membrane protein insertion porin family